MAGLCPAKWCPKANIQHHLKMPLKKDVGV